MELHGNFLPLSSRTRLIIGGLTLPSLWSDLKWIEGERLASFQVHKDHRPVIIDLGSFSTRWSFRIRSTTRCQFFSLFVILMMLEYWLMGRLWQKHSSNGISLELGEMILSLVSVLLQFDHPNERLPHQRIPRMKSKEECRGFLVSFCFVSRNV